MLGWELIYMSDAFVNDYILTLSKSRRLRERQQLHGVIGLTPKRSASRDWRSRVKS